MPCAGKDWLCEMAHESQGGARGLTCAWGPTRLALGPGMPCGNRTSAQQPRLESVQERESADFVRPWIISFQTAIFLAKPKRTCVQIAAPCFCSQSVLFPLVLWHPCAHFCSCQTCGAGSGGQSRTCCELGACGWLHPAVHPLRLGVSVSHSTLEKLPAQLSVSWCLPARLCKRAIS